jgi:hypothetical protein
MERMENGSCTSPGLGNASRGEKRALDNGNTNEDNNVNKYSFRAM